MAIISHDRVQTEAITQILKQNFSIQILRNLHYLTLITI